MVRIYDRPNLDQSNEGRPLFVTGNLPVAVPKLAYEGRLQIHNQIGACQVDQVGGDPLPPGTRLYVDGDEVVVAWPEFARGTAPIPNPGFESGVADWQLGAGWSVTTNNPIAGSRSAVYARNSGTSIISSTARYPVNPGVPISAQCQVRQGASSAGNAGAGVRLEFRDASGKVISNADGNMVMSASNNRVYPSSVSEEPPDDAVTVNVAGVGLRKRENKDLWIDTFTWDHYVAAAGMEFGRTIRLTLRVRDSGGRVAYWDGVLGELTIYFTSHLYPIDAPVESAITSAEITGFRHWNSVTNLPDAVSRGIQSTEIVGFVHRGMPTITPAEEVLQSAQIVSFLHRATPTASVSDESAASAEITGFRHRREPSTEPFDSAIVSAEIRGFVHGT